MLIKPDGQVVYRRQGDIDPLEIRRLILANLPDDNYIGHQALWQTPVNSIKRHLRLFFLYFAQYAKVRMAYKADFIIAFFSSMAATVLGFGFVLVLFSKIPRLQDWSFNEVMFLYGFSLIPLGFFNVVSWNLYEFGELYIIEGKFDRVLLRPVDTLFQVIFEKFRLESLQEVVTGFVVVAICIRRLHLILSASGLSLVCADDRVRSRHLHGRVPDSDGGLVLV